jgi:hypothetical protein
VYVPRLYGAATIHFAEARRKSGEVRRVAFLVPLDNVTRTLDWEAAWPTAITPAELLREPPQTANYLPLPAATMDVKVFARWTKSFDRWLARTQRLAMPSKADGEEVALRPKRGGVSVELVGIAWELV